MVVTDRRATSWDALRKRLARRCSIERMRPDRLRDLCAFFQRAYADQPVASAFQDADQILQRWQWLNEANPIRLEDGRLPAWLCLKDGRLVGHFAVLPAIVVAHGRIIPICWGRDLIVAPEARQQGVGPLLIASTVMAVGHPFLIAGLNETVYPMYQRLGFVDWGLIPLRLRVYQPARLLDTLRWPRAACRMVAPWVNIVQQLRTRRGRAGRLSCVRLERFDESFDQWWAGIEPAFHCVVRRTSATMTWRYLRHPTHRYTAFAALDGTTMRGVVVVRHGRSRGLPCGWMSELLTHPQDQDTMKALVGHAEEWLRSTAPEPLVFIRCAIFHHVSERVLERSGFLQAPSPMHWMLTSANDRSGGAALGQRDEWFLSTGDSDLDAL